MFYINFYYLYYDCCNKQFATINIHTYTKQSIYIIIIDHNNLLQILLMDETSIEND
jgi:hypothetical protein